jgi:hypothetical protein
MAEYPWSFISKSRERARANPWGVVRKSPLLTTMLCCYSQKGNVFLKCDNYSLELTIQYLVSDTSIFDLKIKSLGTGGSRL